MSTEYQRILRVLDALGDAERPQLVQMWVARRSHRMALERQLRRLESDLEAARKEERRLAKIVLGMDTVTKT